MENATVVRRVQQTFVLRSNTTGEFYPLAGEMLVGREAECAIPLLSVHISRYHAKIKVSPEGVFLEDLQSSNGTYVNGQRIQSSVPIRVGDEVAFDDLTFRLTTDIAGEANQTVLGTGRPLAVKPSQPASPPKSAAKRERHSIDTPPPIRASRSDYQALLDELDSIPLESDLMARLEPELSNYIGSADREDPVLAKTPPKVKPSAPKVKPSKSSLKDLVDFDSEVALEEHPHFMVMSAPIRGKVIELKNNGDTRKWRIGGDASSEIRLVNRAISPNHAHITKTAAGDFIIAATNAQNGFSVNGQATTQAVLSHGDKVRIGNLELVFRMDSPQRSLANLTQPDTTKKGSGWRGIGIAIAFCATTALFAALFIWIKN